MPHGTDLAVSVRLFFNEQAGCSVSSCVTFLCVSVERFYPLRLFENLHVDLRARVVDRSVYFYISNKAAAENCANLEMSGIYTAGKPA